MTNFLPQGTNGVSFYRYMFLNQPDDPPLSYNFNNTNIKWANINVGSATLVSLSDDGDYYFYFASYNDEGIYSAQKRFGPYKYYQDIPGNLTIQADKEKVDPDGIDSAIITSELITNIFTGNPLSDGTLFNITSDVADVLILPDGDISSARAGLQVGTKNSRLNFRVASLYEGQVTITVTSVANLQATDEIEIDFVPELHDDITFYNNIVLPGRGDIAELWYNLKDGDNITDEDHITIDIYAVHGMKFKSLDLGQKRMGWHKFEWDLKHNNQYVKSGTYFFIIKGNNFREIRKLIVVR